MSLLLALCAEVVFYPQIAGLVGGRLGYGPGPGSSIAFFRDVYVLPGGAILGALVTVSWFPLKKRTRTVLWTAWVANVFLLSLSLFSYFWIVGTAGRLR